jgi:L-threonylcarbamoyladenylate synthase
MRGGIVLYPTDTLYGLAVDATNPKALARLRALKGRETKKPISMVVATVEAMSDHIEWNDTARKLAHSHLPGPLTLVLPARPHVLPDLQLLGMVGIRVPEDAFALALSQTFGRPYTATSANRSGQVTQTTTKEILRQFGSLIHEIDLVIDAGERSGGKASTVVTFKGTTPYILREGVLSKEDLGL